MMLSNFRMHKSQKVVISKEWFIMASFIMYFSFDFWVPVNRALLKTVGLGEYAFSTTLVVIYLLAFFYALLSRKVVSPEFIVLFVALIVDFTISIIIHPNYEYWYTRDIYGVYDYVFRPDNGIYVFFFIMAVREPDKLWSYLKKAAFLALLYNAYKYSLFMKTGFWEIKSYKTGLIRQTSYNLEFGYDVLLYALIYLYSALKTKKIFDWVMAGLGVALVVFGGSRGAVLCIGIFLILYFLSSTVTLKKRVIQITVIAVVGVIIIAFNKYVLDLLVVLFNKIGLPSRFLSTLITGTVADDNGRNALWSATIDMIKANPFGYGAMGTRHVLYVLHTAAYPHNMFLELIADYGVILGGGICIFLVVKTISILRMKDIDNYKGLFLAFIGQTCQLLLSGTIYHRNGFWGALALGILICRFHKREYKAQCLNLYSPL